MPLLEKHTDLLLGIWKTEETVSGLLALLDRHDRYLPFLESCKSESRKEEWLATRVLLKELLGEELAVEYHPDGSPFLPEKPGFFVSISHTKGYVAVYCSPLKQVGIDIEYQAERIQKIKHKFMSEEELSRIDPACETGYLLLCWCAKETLFKLIRQMDVDFREHLHIHPFPYGKEGKISVWETKTPKTKAFELAFKVTSEYTVTFSR